MKPRKILTRGGGRPGDDLYVTGQIGAAAAGLEWLQRDAGGEDRQHMRSDPALVERRGRRAGGVRRTAIAGRNRGRDSAPFSAGTELPARAWT